MINFFYKKKKKNECGLLPYIREDLHGISNNMQFCPWPILEFDVQDSWKRTMGEGVKIAVLDTGCDIKHQDLKDNILNGWNIISNNSNVADKNGHGTHVAGTIAASNNTLGVVGVAPKAKIIPVKVLGDDGMGSNIDVARGIIWASDNDADLITMSLGSTIPSDPIRDALRYAMKKNVAVFCAAGNSGNDSEIQYPAKYEETISIGAIGRSLNVCSFSCTGVELDFVAPGEDIPSCIPNNQYAIMSGTSMATPFAVGCAALLLSYLRKDDQNKRLSQNEYINIFTKNTKHVSQRQFIGNKKYEGNGIIVPSK